jgi:hypothetical protein
MQAYENTSVGDPFFVWTELFAEFDASLAKDKLFLSNNFTTLIFNFKNFNIF